MSENRPPWCPFDGQSCSFPDCTYDVDECAVLEKHHSQLPAPAPARPAQETPAPSPLFNGLADEIRW